MLIYPRLHMYVLNQRKFRCLVFPAELTWILDSINICIVAIKIIRNTHAVSTNHIAVICIGYLHLFAGLIAGLIIKLIGLINLPLRKASKVVKRDSLCDARYCFTAQCIQLHSRSLQYLIVTENTRYISLATFSNMRNHFLTFCE